MNPSNHRLTLVVQGMPAIERNWTPPNQSTRILFIESFADLDVFLRDDLDVERVVLDGGSAGASQFLRLLANTRTHFNGDVLLVGADGSGFLSSPGRGGDRLLYALSAPDVEFYLAVHGVTSLTAASNSVAPVATISQWQTAMSSVA